MNLTMSKEMRQRALSSGASVKDPQQTKANGSSQKPDVEPSSGLIDSIQDLVEALSQGKGVLQPIRLDIHRDEEGLISQVDVTPV